MHKYVVGAGQSVGGRFTGR